MGFWFLCCLGTTVTALFMLIGLAPAALIVTNNRLGDLNSAKSACNFCQQYSIDYGAHSKQCCTNVSYSSHLCKPYSYCLSLRASQSKKLTQLKQVAIGSTFMVPMFIVIMLTACMLRGG